MLRHALETLPAQGYGRPQARSTVPDANRAAHVGFGGAERRFHNKRAINSANMRCHFEIRNAS